MRVIKSMKMNYRDLCISVVNRIYSKYNPNKINDIPNLFEKYKDREKELIELICKKYDVPKDEVKEYVDEYKSIFQEPKRTSSTKIVLILLSSISVVLLIIFAFNKQNEGQTKNNEIETIAHTSKDVETVTNETSNRLTIHDLILMLDEPNQESISKLLKSKSNEWEFVGYKGDELGWKSTHENGRILICNISGRTIEYTYFTKNEFEEMKNSIISNGFKEEKVIDSKYKTVVLYLKTGYMLTTGETEQLDKTKSPSGIYDLTIGKYNTINNEEPTQSNSTPTNSDIVYYEIIHKTHFYSSPNENDMLNAYLVEGEKLEALREENGFVYTEFTNPKGETTVGWIKKSDLVETYDD